MSAIDIPVPLPSAITPPARSSNSSSTRTSTNSATPAWSPHLALGPARRQPGPISHMDWSQFDGDGPPSTATLAAESTADEPPLHPPTPWGELNQARSVCWLCTFAPEDGGATGSYYGVDRKLGYSMRMLRTRDSTATTVTGSSWGSGGPAESASGSETRGSPGMTQAPVGCDSSRAASACGASATASRSGTPRTRPSNQRSSTSAARTNP